MLLFNKSLVINEDYIGNMGISKNRLAICSSLDIKVIHLQACKCSDGIKLARFSCECIHLEQRFFILLLFYKNL